MTRRLIFIGGPPGVGKSSVARILLQGLDEIVWLDGDDLWNMNPFRVDERTIAMVQDNVVSVLSRFLEADLSTIVFTWVLHRQEIIDGLLARLPTKLADHIHCLTLVCGAETLNRRFANDPNRGEVTALALERLGQCLSEDLRTEKIDTEGLTPDEIAAEIARRAGMVL